MKRWEECASLITVSNKVAINFNMFGSERLRSRMDSLSAISGELAELNGQISDIFRALSNGFQKLEKVKDSTRQSRQLEELTGKMRECKRLIKEFDKEVKEEESRCTPDTSRMLSEKKQSMIKELNSYVALKKQYASSLENKRADLFDGPGDAEGFGEENVLLASSMLVENMQNVGSCGGSLCSIASNISSSESTSSILLTGRKSGLYSAAMTNHQLMDTGNQMMDETDQAIERSKKVVQDTVNVGAETAAALKAQTEQMGRIVNELDSIHFSIKKASQLVKEIGRQVATDRCIMALLFIIVIGVIAVIIVKLVNPNNKNIADIPGLPPPAARRLLWDP
ncbi:hypothetical protein HHK36_019608 [Tetracentron sinense]|uniref:t-SNARE coiled-coil homology domain-containing protein n=1 Tax=Tetracentron sinense TaxID=13715 RepID=A0A835D9A9_TETSI|nr:hypothetical protein HHK36_019608 [Tetracentron sinense]